MTPQLTIGVCGFIGSGKDTVADHLTGAHAFKRDSFAATLKDAVAAIFGWDREMLEGRTKESRLWRDQIDPWWAKRLGFPELTPRWVMQYFGTEVMRRTFHDDIWIASLENKLRKFSHNVTIPDSRFPNEFRAIEGHGGIVVRVKRGPEPAWFDIALTANLSPDGAERAKAVQALKDLAIHPSEWAWIGQPVFATIENDGSLQDLYHKTDIILRRYQSAKAIATAFTTGHSAPIAA